jgi:hypothetical protein
MFWRRSVADQVDEELDFHLEMVTRELIARGRSEADARAEARRRLRERGTTEVFTVADASSPGSAGRRTA